MTKYLDKSFNSGANSRKYVDNWDSVFGKKAYTMETFHAAVDAWHEADTELTVYEWLGINEETYKHVVENPNTGFDKWLDEQLKDPAFEALYIKEVKKLAKVLKKKAKK